MQRKRILYLGTDPKHFEGEGVLTHYPVIEIVPRPIDCPKMRAAFSMLHEYTHIIFTSKNAVQIFFAHLKKLSISSDILQNTFVVAIGDVTAYYLSLEKIRVAQIADLPTQEGLIQIIQDWKNPFILLPKSSISRDILILYFQKNQIRHHAVDLYETRLLQKDPIPNLEDFDEIVFTSPSTVRGFLAIYGKLPRYDQCVAIGPITKRALEKNMEPLS